jgi:hypothetical protein
MHHPHVHCVVPGGIAPDDSHWINCRKGFFLPVRVLSRVFRGKFIQGLKQAFGRGELAFHGGLNELATRDNFERLLDQAVRHDWVVYAKRPFGGPRQVLKYLARPPSRAPRQVPPPAYSPCRGCAGPVRRRASCASWCPAGCSTSSRSVSRTRLNHGAVGAAFVVWSCCRWSAFYAGRGLTLFPSVLILGAVRSIAGLIGLRTELPSFGVCHVSAIYWSISQWSPESPAFATQNYYTDSYRLCGHSVYRCWNLSLRSGKC